LGSLLCNTKLAGFQTVIKYFYAHANHFLAHFRTPEKLFPSLLLNVNSRAINYYPVTAALALGFQAVASSSSLDPHCLLGRRGAIEEEPRLN
jgi:hypothetical protein